MSVSELRYLKREIDEPMGVQLFGVLLLQTEEGERSESRALCRRRKSDAPEDHLNWDHVVLVARLRDDERGRRIDGELRGV